MKFTPKSSEQDLILGCRKEHPLAQKYVYQRYFGKMLGICMRYTSHREEATEVLNMAFFKVFTNIHQFKEPGTFAGWIARIVFNTSIDHVRKQITYKKVIDLNSEKETSINNDAIDNLATEDLYKAIQLLPPSSRTVFCMYVIDGYKHQEIGDKLGISDGTSKWHLSNARKELKKILVNKFRIRVAI